MKSLFFVRMAIQGAGIALIAPFLFAAIPLPALASAPGVTTYPAINITATNATLYGFVYPNGQMTDYWFDWGLSSGSLVNATPAAQVGPYNPSNAFATISGLQPYTLYYYRLTARNADSTSYGSILSFQTGASSSSLQTREATNITSTSAMLNGYLNPMGASDTHRWFEWGPTSSLGYRTTVYLHGSSADYFGDTIYGLAPGSTYYFRAVSQNSQGTVYGNVLSFSASSTVFPPPPPCSSCTIFPQIYTRSATSVGNISATVNGFLDPMGTTDTSRWFEWGPTSSLGYRTTVYLHGSSADYFGDTIYGLAPRTTYYFQAFAQSSAGTVRGVLRSLTTTGETVTPTPPPPYSAPYVRTDYATSITYSTATLGGYVNPNGSPDTMRWFEWGVTPGLGNSTVRLNTGSQAASFAQTISGLNPNTTYYFRIAAQNSTGLAYGSTLSFSSLQISSFPTALTQSPTFVAERTAVLNGYAISNPSSATTMWFEWGLTSSLGIQTPRRTINGVTSSSFTDSLTGLASHTRYFYRAMVENPSGISRGSMISFRTTSSESAPTPPAPYVPPSTPSSTNPLPGLTITKEAYNPSFPDCRVSDCIAVAGNTVQYTIHVRNIGATDINNVSIKDAISPYMDYVSASDDGSFNISTRQVIWTFPVIHPSEVKGVTSNLRAKKLPQDVLAENIATVWVNSSSKSSNKVTIHLNASSGSAEVAGPITLSMISGQDSVPVGQSVHFTLAYQNTSGDSLGNGTLTFTLPPELAYEQLITEKPSAEKTISVADQTIHVPVGDLMPNQKGTVILVATIRKGTQNNKIFTTVATLSYTNSSTGAVSQESTFAVTTAVAGKEFASGAFTGLSGWAIPALLIILGFIGLLVFVLILRSLLATRHMAPAHEETWRRWDDVSKPPLPPNNLPHA